MFLNCYPIQHNYLIYPFSSKERSSLHEHQTLTTISVPCLLVLYSKRILDKSILNDLDSFHVINQLPQDIMYVLLEGIVPHELQLMLYNYVIERKFYTLEKHNERIASFCYSSDEARDRPTPITHQTITNESSMRQSCKLLQYCRMFNDF